MPREDEQCSRGRARKRSRYCARSTTATVSVLKLRSLRQIQRAICGYGYQLIRLIAQSYGRDTVQQAWLEFTSGTAESFYGHEPNTELFFAWLFHEWSATPEKGQWIHDATLYGIPPTRAYLDRHANRLNPLLRQYLEACLKVRSAFYEIVDCTPDVGFNARDIFTGVQFEVSEELASTSIKEGEIVFAHLTSVAEITMMDAVSPMSFPAVSKSRLLDSSAGRASDERTGRELYFELARLHSST
jgi:hypothetical protein